MSNFSSRAECSAHNLTTYDTGRIIYMIGMFFDSLAVLGSLAILLLYVCWKDLRSGAQSIITFLAIADLFTAAGYTVQDVTVLVIYGEGKQFVVPSYFETLCVIVTYISVCSTISSLMWTSILAFYFYMLAVLNYKRLAESLFPLYHIIAWGLPVLLGLVFLSTGTMNFAPFGAAILCNFDNPDTFYKEPYTGSVGLHIAIKIPEIAGYIFILVLYLTTIIRIAKHVSICRPIRYVQNRVYLVVQQNKCSPSLELNPLIHLL